MRLIGVSKLSALAQNASGDLRGAVLALHAELVAAEWCSAADATAAFPAAKCERKRLVINLDHGHCVVVAISFETGIGVVEFAGRRMDRTKAPKQKWRRSV